MVLIYTRASVNSGVIGWEHGEGLGAHHEPWAHHQTIRGQLKAQDCLHAPKSLLWLLSTSEPSEWLCMGARGSGRTWLAWWEGCARLGASWGAAPCLIPSAGCFSLPNCSPPCCTSWAFAGGCICERISGLRLHLLMEIALTFIFICWPNRSPQSGVWLHLSA